ncbi:N-acetylmuramoyl-L-alanine amidase [Halomonas sp. LS-001]
MRYITIHCSATRASQYVDAAEIRRWHVDGNGWRDIGYHYVIKRDGTVEKGRSENVMGAHVGGHNTGNIGICLVGGVAEDGKTPENNFTPAQWAALEPLLKDLHGRYPQAVIMGHNGFPGHESRGCPCFDWRTYRDQLHAAWQEKPIEWSGHWYDEIDMEGAE